MIASQGFRVAHKHNGPDIQINLGELNPGSSYTYTTDDSINGTVSIAVGHDIHFDDIDISFEGLCTVIIFATCCLCMGFT